VVVRGNQVLVPVVIGYRGREVEALLLLDTGASFTIVHENVARRVMLTGTENREAIVVGGSRIPIRMAQVDYIQVGPYRVSGAQVAIIRHKGPQLARQGLLGMDILQALDYRIDMNRRVIVWNR
jgi:predicted aspartyl protease